MDWNGHWTEVKIIFVVGSTEEFGWFHSKKLARELTNINQTIKKMVGQVKWMGGYKIMEGRSNVSKISVMIDATFTFLQLPD